MRHLRVAGVCLCGALAVAGCARDNDAEAARALASVNVIDETNLSDIMLTVADPDEAVAYFRRASGEKPDRLDLVRGLAKSLVRAGKPREAAEVWRRALRHPDAGNADRVALADALLRANDWEGAGAVMAEIPPTYETFDRYRLEAMLADNRKDWARADSFYEIAAGLTTRPAGVLNNWGYSRLTRGEEGRAEALFHEALRHDPNLFIAKNNLVLARASRRDYDLPVVEMTQIERARLLHTMALAAIKQGDVAIGRGLLEEAVATHPQHFDEAVRALRALESNVTN